MEQDDAPRPVIPANDDTAPPISTAKLDEAVRRIARLLGRQIAREVFEAQQAANDNGSPTSDDARPPHDPDGE